MRKDLLNLPDMSLIEINKPLLRLTRESGGGPCPDSTIRFFGEPPSAVYNYPAGTFITVDLLDESGNYLQIVSYTQVGNNIDIVVDSDTPILVNGTPEGDITNWTPINVNLEDPGGNPVAPLSTVLVGNTLTIEVTAPITPSGVLFQFPNGNQYTSYRTGDVGWRMQNGWFNITKPANPAKIARLDYSQGANAFYILDTALTVAGVSSTVRFVDVNGLQVFGVANNVHEVVIDKLTGLMWRRIQFNLTNHWTTWNNSIDLALTNTNITVQGVLYSDWYSPSIEEILSIRSFQNQTLNLVDSATGVTVLDGGASQAWSSNSLSALEAYEIRQDSKLITNRAIAGNYRRLAMRDARNLIS